MARVPYVDPETLPDDYEVLHRESDRLHESIDAERWNTAATVRAFGNNPDLAALHVDTNVSLWTRSGLSPAEVETVILTVARELDSPYEWHAHAITALEHAGMTEEEVLAISRRRPDELDGVARPLFEYVSEFVGETGAVSDRAHEALAEHYDDGTIVGVAMLAGFYVHLHHVATALALEHDETFVGWELENYPPDETRLA